MKPLQERADYVINTALLSTAQNKERICDLFAKNGGAKGAMLALIVLTVLYRRDYRSAALHTLRDAD